MLSLERLTTRNEWDIPAASKRHESYAVWIVAVAAAGLGLTIRLPAVLGATFPVGDGGLFYSIVRSIQIAHYHLPWTTGYDGVPLTYPPLALYIAAGISSVARVSPLTVLRLLPVAVTTAATVPFSWLVTRLLRSRLSIAISALAFPLLPRSSMTLISGGGLTRSFGLLFALAALACAHEMYTRQRWRWTAGTALLCGLTVLSHLEMTWFLALSLLVLAGFRGRTRFGAVSTLVTGIGAAAVSAPWWVQVMVREGVEPFVAAAHTGGAMAGNLLTTAIRFNITDELFFPVLAILALIGLFTSLRREEYLLAVWFVVLMVFDTRSFETDAVVPLALLIGIGVGDVLLPYAMGSRDQREIHSGPGSGLNTGLGRLLRPHPALLLVAFLYVVASTSAVIARSDTPLDAAQRDAMAWMAAETQRDTKVLVITGDAFWGSDNTSEWFPALSQRDSVATVQGSESLPNLAFARQISAYTSAQGCVYRDSSCLDDWASSTGKDFSYVYLARPEYPAVNVPVSQGPAHWALELSLRADQRYVVVYDRPDVVIFARRTGN